jgi:hypothetical protein
LCEEVKVFENSEDTKVDANADPYEPAARGWGAIPVKRQTHEIVDECGDQDQATESPVPPSVEEIACEDQKSILPSVTKTVVEGQNDSNKEQELERVEQQLLDTPAERSTTLAVASVNHGVSPRDEDAIELPHLRDETHLLICIELFQS